MKRFLGPAITSIKTEETNGLVINQVNISKSIQQILTKGFRFLILVLNISAFEELLISVGIMLQTSDAKYLNEFKPNFVVLTVFLIKSVCDHKL